MTKTTYRLPDGARTVLSDASMAVLREIHWNEKYLNGCHKEDLKMGATTYTGLTSKHLIRTTRSGRVTLTAAGVFILNQAVNNE